MSNKCMCCGVEGAIIKTIAIPHMFTNEEVSIDFCKCGYGKTRSSVNLSLVNDEMYSDLDGRIKIYYKNLFNHFVVRYNEVLRRITKNEKQKGKLLEVGSNIGFTANMAKAFGFEVKGCEVNEKSRRFCELVYDIQTYQDFFDISDKFDVITFIDVLEHFQNPYTAIKHAKELLVDGGIIFIQLPNYSSKAAMRQGIQWSWWSVPDHVSHFNYESLSLLAQRIDLKIDWWRTAGVVEDASLWNIFGKKLKPKMLEFVYNNPFYHPGLYNAKRKSGSILQMILR